MQNFQRAAKGWRKLYEKEPNGWDVYLDRAGEYKCILVAGPPGKWFAKYEEVYPGKIIGFAEKVDIDIEQRGPTYGYRPMSDNEVSRILYRMNMGIDLSRVFERVMKKDPIRLLDIKTMKPPGFIEGPLKVSEGILEKIEPGLVKDMDKRIRKRIEKEHPETIVSYV